MWKKYGYFKQQACNFLVKQSFISNQAYQSYRENKKTYYCNLFILGQVTPFFNPPKSLKSDEVKSNDTVYTKFLDLVETLGYLTVHGDSMECFFDYGYSKNNSKVFYSTHKMKTPNSFEATIFNSTGFSRNLVPRIQNFQRSVFFYPPPWTPN